MRALSNGVSNFALAELELDATRVNIGTTGQDFKMVLPMIKVHELGEGSLARRWNVRVQIKDQPK